MATYESNYETLAQVAKKLHKSWTDPKYRAQLVKDQAFARKELEDAGVSLPDTMKIKTVDMKKGTYYLLLTPEPEPGVFSDVKPKDKAHLDAVHIQNLEVAGF